MTRLSVNINKIATLRNARGGKVPDLLKAANDIERFGAEGITIHPRPDQRHIRYTDVLPLKENNTTELNIEGYPSEKFLDLVMEVLPEQVTLVPDSPDVLTSNAGWNTIENEALLSDIVKELKRKGIRTSLFMETDPTLIERAAKIGTDRIELYTEAYADQYHVDKHKAIKPYTEAAKIAESVGLEINAGHDLNLENLKFFAQNIANLKEVSIGHALIADALYFGLENTVQLYLRELKIVDETSL